MLAGKRLLITGVITQDSLAFATAARAQEQGAEVILTSFGRVRRMTERAARHLPHCPDVLELDVTRPEDFAALTAELADRWGTVNGALHSIAFAPPDAINGNFLTTSLDSAKTAFEISAFSLKELAVALLPLMGEGASLVGMDFDASYAWPRYDWMGVSKAALEGVARYLARDLGPRGIRVNLVSAGPIETIAARGIGADFAALVDRWATQAPLGWVADDPGPVADAVAFFLSDASRAITGEILHVDGGFHAIGAATESVAVSGCAVSE